jgi:Domain of unknown function (DUF4157)/HNH/ENDO VII superfamily nuclease with conserved GHE residues
MKAAETKTSATAQHRTKGEGQRQPFFQREKAGSALDNGQPYFFFPNGSHGIQRMPFFARPTVQPKLRIGPPGDKYEQEADSVADRVVQRLAQTENGSQQPLSAARPALQRKPIFEGEAAPEVQAKPLNGHVLHVPQIQKKCTECEQEEDLQEVDGPGEEEGLQRKPIFDSATPPPEELGEGVQRESDARAGNSALQLKCADCTAEAGESVQRKETSDGPTTAPEGLGSQLGSSKGGGSPLPENSRTQMEGSFGADFSNVRIHTDSRAEQMSQSVQAQAFTHGSDIYFNKGKFDTAGRSGQRLLAHELTHTVQQSGGAKLKPETESTSPKNTIQRDATTASASISTTPSNIPTLQQAAKNLYVWLTSPTPSSNREDIFKKILQKKGFGKALRDEYRKQNNKELDTALAEGLNEKDTIRAKRYLDYGELRIADKVYIASKGAGTDEDTLYRILPLASKVRAKVEEDFGKEADYIKDYPSSVVLPNKENSRIGGLLVDELSGTDAVKAKALYSFGELRAIDEVYIAIEDAKVEELMEALQKGMSQNKDFFVMENDYLKAYDKELFSNLNMLLQRAVIDHKEKLKIWQIIGKGTALERIKYAVEGPGTDEDEIWDTIRTAKGEALTQLRTQFNDKNSELYQLLDGDLNKGEMDRATAQLTENPSAIQQLMGAGAEDGGAICDEIKMSAGDKFNKYREAFNSKDGVFEGYCFKKMNAEQRGHTISIINGSPEEKINVAIGKFTDDEDYIFHVLKNFAANDPAKKAVMESKTLMDKMQSALSGFDYNKVLDLLQLEDESIEDKVKHTGEKIGRERSFIADFSNAADAMDDEYRELLVGLERAKADGTITPEEQKELGKMQQQTDASIAVYTKVRDELEENAATVFTTVTAVVIAIGTGGLGSGLSAAMIAQQLAQAALISACARVAAMKVAKGDRFEMFGADGASSFTAGAVDGIFNVFGGAGASKVVDKLFQKAVTDAVVTTSAKGFQSVGKKILTDAVEGGMSAGVGAAVETSSKEDTWKGGFVKGIEEVVDKAGTSAAMGVGIGAGIGAVGAIINKIKAKKAGEVDDVHGRGGKTDLGDEAEVLRIKDSLENKQLEDVLKGTAKKPGTELTQLELNSEVNWATKHGEVKPSAEAGYTHEIELNNGHKLRKKDNGTWCRFSNDPLCGIDGAKLNEKVEDNSRETPGGLADLKAKNKGEVPRQMPQEIGPGEEVTIPYKNGKIRARVAEVREGYVKFDNIRGVGGKSTILSLTTRLEQFGKWLKEGKAIRWLGERGRLMKVRPAYEPGLVDKIWENAKGIDGKVRDPNPPLEELNWDKSKHRFDQWHMGHKPGAEYVELVDRYVNGEISYNEFLKEYNNPANYRPELPAKNLSHEFEQKNTRP